MIERIKNLFKYMKCVPEVLFIFKAKNYLE